MEKFDERVAFRLSSEQREKINHLIHEGRFKNLSQFLRSAIKELLTNERRDCCASE